MNQKVLRYALLTGVFVVWGVIFYKVLAALGREENFPKTLVSAPDSTEYTHKKDTFSLLANYADPFLPIGSLELSDSMDTDLLKSNSAITQVQPSITPQPVVPLVVISFVQYLGMIANIERKTKTAMISIRGKETVAKENDIIEDVEIKSIAATKIAVVYKGKKFNISRKL
jgi:hypothetical protein